MKNNLQCPHCKTRVSAKSFKEYKYEHCFKDLGVDFPIKFAKNEIKEWEKFIKDYGNKR